jgi:hypothetical protein
LPRSWRSQELSLAQPVPNDPKTCSRRTTCSPTYRAGARSQHVHTRHCLQPQLDPDLPVHDCLKCSVPFVSFHAGCGARPGRAVDTPSWSPTSSQPATCRCSSFPCRHYPDSLPAATAISMQGMMAIVRAMPSPREHNLPPLSRTHTASEHSWMVGQRRRRRS